MVPLLAVLVAAGLAGPDGIDSRGDSLYISCEGDGTVLACDSSLQFRTVASGLNSPEGICAAGEGRLLITEDSSQGRLLELFNGVVTASATGLECPEGVATGPDGTVWFTTGGIEAGGVFTTLWRIGDQGAERVYSLPSVFSFSDLTVSNSGEVYVCSESSGILGEVSVFVYSPVDDTFLPFAAGIRSCEGICLTHGSFPMYAVSEEGMVFSVDSTGEVRTVYSTSATLEDAAFLHGSLYLTNDADGTVERIPVE